MWGTSKSCILLYPAELQKVIKTDLMFSTPISKVSNGAGQPMRTGGTGRRGEGELSKIVKRMPGRGGWVEP